MTSIAGPNFTIGASDESVALQCVTSYPVRILQNGEVYQCGEHESLLHGMARLGKKGIPAGCLNGGCGVCKVLIRSGNVRKTGAMSRAHISEQEEAEGVVLTCKVAPLSAIELDVIGKMVKVVTCSSWCGMGV